MPADPEELRGWLSALCQLESKGVFATKIRHSEITSLAGDEKSSLAVAFQKAFHY